MLAKHSCGHEIDVPPSNAWFVRKSLCDGCKEIAKKLQEEQHKRFKDIIEKVNE